MNLALLALIAFAGVVALWAAQSAALWRAGEPLAWPLQSRSQDGRVKWVRRVFVQAIWAGLILGFPWVSGSDPLRYFAALFPAVEFRSLVVAYLCCLSVMTAGFVFEAAMGWVRWAPQFDARTCRRKLFRRLTLSLPLATMEECVFRGLILQQLSLASPDGLFFQSTALLASSVLFSLVHFLRPDEGRPFWQPAFGFFLVGMVCGGTFLASGHSLWLPIALHGAGILVAESSRIFTCNEGPRLITGYQSYPHCGLCGAAVLVTLAVALLQ